MPNFDEYLQEQLKDPEFARDFADCKAELELSPLSRSEYEEIAPGKWKRIPDVLDADEIIEKEKI